jgi:heterodisulfide reductase subunit A
MACSDACPEGAIDLDAEAEILEMRYDAVVLATGFVPYDPTEKPYGYGVHPNVVTNLDLERILRAEGLPLRPSDGLPARNIAFVQCVGSRDARLGHLWCSRVCCGSALRMGDWIRHRLPDASITVFYMDIQTFGRDFQDFHTRLRKDFRFVRAIPGDVLDGRNGCLEVIYADPESGASTEATFDLLVLSVGLLPPSTRGGTSVPTLDTDMDGFFRSRPDSGVFVAGAAGEPMGIEDAIATAARATRGVQAWLRRGVCKEETQSRRG